MASFSVSYSFKAIDQFSETTRKIGNNLSILARKAEMASKKFKKLGEGMTKMGKSLSLKLTAPLVAAGALSVRTADKFEQSMERMRVVASLTNKQYANLRNQAIHLGATTDFTASQIVKAQGKMAEVGFNYNQIIRATPPAITLASAAMMDLSDASEITARIMKGYNISAKEMVSVNDKLAFIATRTHMDLSELSRGIGKMKATADSVGMGLNDILPILAALDDQSVDTRQAISGLRMGLQYIINPGTQAQKLFKAMHLQLRDMSGQLRKPIDILREFKEKTIPSTREQAASIAFGQTAGSIMNKLMEGLPAVDKYKKGMDKLGLATRLANVDMIDLSGAEVRLKRANNLLAISYGDQLSPTISILLNKLAAFETKLAFSSKGTKQLLGDITFLGAALGPVLLTFGKFIVILALISEKVPIAGKALHYLGLSFRFLWKSVFLPIAIITTLTALFDEAYKHITRFRNAINETANVILKFFKHFEASSPFISFLKMAVGHVEDLHTAMSNAASVHAGASAGGGALTSGISMGAGTPLLRPSVLQTAIQQTVKSSLDINVQDPNGVVKSVSGAGDHDMNLNVGSSMLFSRV